MQDTVSLKDVCRDWPRDPPPVSLKHALIDRVAAIARQLHENGVNHRDFYLCHFLLGNAPPHPLCLIDLHRVQIRAQTPQRWIIKDLGGLYYSALDIGLTRRDLLRFIRTYENQPLRDTLARNTAFWNKVTQRARWINQQA